MTKFDTSIYILQIAVTMDESFEVTLTCFVMLKILTGTTNQHFLSMASEHPSFFNVP